MFAAAGLCVRTQSGHPASHVHAFPPQPDRKVDSPDPKDLHSFKEKKDYFQRFGEWSPRATPTTPSVLFLLSLASYIQTDRPTIPSPVGSVVVSSAARNPEDPPSLLDLNSDQY